MLRFVKYILAYTLAAFFIFSCNKEKSIESGESDGILSVDENGGCLPALQRGPFEAGLLLDGNESYLEISADVALPGHYQISSDTINGMYFIATGVFAEPGTNSFKLRAVGTPAAAGNFDFTVTYLTSTCTFSVQVEAEGTFSPSVYELVGSPGTCSNAQVNGAYVVGGILNSSNTVTLDINVTKIGTWAINTIVTGGMSFEGDGRFTGTGPQTITLKGKGTPASAGVIDIPVTAGTSSCAFKVTVVSRTEFTIDCNSFILNGSYKKGVALTIGNTIQIPVNVSTLGGYIISTSTINGVTLSGSGTFASPGANVITLTASGTPAEAGEFSYNISWGSVSCTIKILYANTGFDWNFTENSIVFSGTTKPTTTYTVTGGTATFTFEGTNAAGENIRFVITDANDGEIKNGETYITNAATGNAATFQFSNASRVLTANSTTTTVSMNFNILNHNKTEKRMIGVFQGTCLENTTSRTISAGTFVCTYQ